MRESVHLYLSQSEGERIWSFQASGSDAKLYSITVPDGFYVGRDDLGRVAIFRTGATRPVGLKDATMADMRPRLKFIDAKGHSLVEAYPVI